MGSVFRITGFITFYGYIASLSDSYQAICFVSVQAFLLFLSSFCFSVKIFNVCLNFALWQE